MKNLYIAEKPSVAREFAKALGMKGAATAGARDGYLENEDTMAIWSPMRRSLHGVSDI